ncbi:hypothetical protein Purlil1_5596 [Purpureocillium lilacinum]|uniref:Uncharacterized protein n=1 Tax=Purpureocillium lilacinum TaxID=33203 RepID=A0ABR0C187_PURLI|nr:hypothetical protein Purlil1_5596 [Purpureocillium lilacinum]
MHLAGTLSGSSLAKADGNGICPCGSYGALNSFCLPTTDNCTPYKRKALMKAVPEEQSSAASMHVSTRSNACRAINRLEAIARFVDGPVQLPADVSLCHDHAVPRLESHHPNLH